VIDILSGEVAIGHSYVSGGDLPNINRVPLGLLSVHLEKSNGFYRFKKIFKGER
jgi:tricorn protease